MSVFNWKTNPSRVNLKELDRNKRHQMGSAMSAWRRGKAGIYTVAPIDKPLHGGAFTKAIPSNKD